MKKYPHQNESDYDRIITINDYYEFLNCAIESVSSSLYLTALLRLNLNQVSAQIHMFFLLSLSIFLSLSFSVSLSHSLSPLKSVH